MEFLSKNQGITGREWEAKWLAETGEPQGWVVLGRAGDCAGRSNKQFGIDLLQKGMRLGCRRDNLKDVLGITTKLALCMHSCMDLYKH